MQTRLRGFLAVSLAVSGLVLASSVGVHAAPDTDEGRFSSIPSGRCSVLAPGTPSYRFTAAQTAGTYRQIGKSGQGRAIWAEHWGKPTGPQVLIVGQIHGDECSPAYLVEALRQVPPKNFGIWLIPTLNPDALDKGTRLTPSGADLNRDGYSLRTPEARALMRFTKELNPVLSVHVHAPYGFVGSRNGGLAASVSKAIARSAGWRDGQGSGTLAGSKGSRAFLWDGQERVLRRHQSVLIELPATSKLEAAGAPQPERLVVVSSARLRVLTNRIRDALYGAVEKASVK
jgi:hypothetical protein